MLADTFDLVGITMLTDATFGVSCRDLRQVSPIHIQCTDMLRLLIGRNYGDDGDYGDNG